MVVKQDSDTSEPERLFRLFHDAFGRFVLESETGEQHLNVYPVRLFPMSDPKRWVSLCDSRGRELVCIENPDTLPAEIRAALNRELARKEFLPILERVLYVSSNSEPCEWHVITDRGETRFILQSEDDIRRLGKHGVLVIDAHGLRYLIPDERQLDPYSKRVVEWYV